MKNHTFPESQVCDDRVIFVLPIKDLYIYIYKKFHTTNLFCGAVAERLRHRSLVQKVTSSIPAWTSVLR